MKNNRRKFNDKLNRLLEVPNEVGSVQPKITIVGFDEMLIENYKGISEYEEFYIKVNTGMGIININGLGLLLEQITDEDIMVRGRIENIDIERLE
ncbi:MAG: YabP/YqfC family sporulation protein [Firmicutes bacterium]|nr:YabP/YqfC family sporulation protein [Bacillota bacterium]